MEPKPGTLCKTCSFIETCDMKDACRYCGGYKKKKENKEKSTNREDRKRSQRTTQRLPR